MRASSVFSILTQAVFALLGLALFMLPLWAGAARGETLPGPVPAEVTEIVDGDTVRVRAHIWLGQAVETKVRLEGIDAPEAGGRAKCSDERLRADLAKARLAELVGGQAVMLYDIEPDKYAGRVIARLESADGRDPGRVLLAEGLAVPYDPRADWCAIKGG